MTDKIRRRKIQIETHEVTIIRRQGGRFAYCRACQAMVAAVVLSDFAILTGMSLDDFPAEKNEIHFIDTGEGDEQMICGSCLKDKNFKRGRS